MRVTVESGSEWKASKPTRTNRWFGPTGQARAALAAACSTLWRDGQRFLVLKPVESAEPTTIVVVQNWLEELKQRVPAR